ncbi:right-handed parallel beta-helix repeat-containing protein [Parabacteroides goldsteinii]|uniref:right-handed parallel beta-helix repeat-containing protein n=1 Tax=Parabacteroides goldsteinii TaxID=328812 RepID=UPI002431AF01|nr:right-handed parallel beta-helix repeat-containing protein [Parabacteroides goldsteinii]
MKMYTFVLALLLCACTSTQRTFYVDSITGDDANKGASPTEAWKSLDKLNQQVFEPGDRILFKSGTEYVGQFEPKGSGSEGKPVMVDKYGDGGKPILHGDGQKQHTILLEGLEYWELNNLEVTNKGEKPDPGRNGIIIYAWDKGDVHHIHLKNLTVRDVNGSCIKNEGAGNGIYWHNGGDEVPTRFVDLLIENCHIYRCQRNGITGNGNSGRDKWFPSLNVVIRGNLIEQVPGDGIVPIACDGALVEHNIVRDSPDLLRIEDAAAGIWPWSCDNTIIQFNEVSGQNAKWDGQAFDSDYNCRNTVIQYNFSHDNAGGFVMVCNEGNTLGEPYNIGTENTIIRHNVSINDGLRAYPTRPGWFSPVIHISGPAKQTAIEENVIVIMKKPSPEIDRSVLIMDNWGGPWPENTVFNKNIFYVINDDLEYKFITGSSKSTQFDGNVFYGNFINKPDDRNAIEKEPDFTSGFPFHENFPDYLREKVIKRLKQQ